MVQVLDDDGTLGHVAPPRVIGQHGKFSRRPYRLQDRTVARAPQVDQARLESDAMLVQRDSTVWENEDSGW